MPPVAAEAAEEAPRTLLLVRHGRTSWNAEGRAQGHADVPLDEIGHEQAAELGRRLVHSLADHDVTGLWSSDLTRATQTAAEVAGMIGLPVRYDERLREFNVGERQGLTHAEFTERFPDHPPGLIGYDGHPPVSGAESAELVRKRMDAALQAILAEMEPGETGVVVLHGASLRVALLDLLGWPWQQVAGLAPVRNCHWTEVRINANGEAVLVAYNTSG